MDYVKSTTVCRSKTLLAYFGEKQSIRCGKCDVCLRRNREELSEEEFHYLQTEIVSLLQDGTKSIDFLVETLHHPERKIVEVIRWLLENEIISKDMDKLIMQKDT
jgi:ATP-dependent DNA helicase RecQ